MKNLMYVLMMACSTILAISNAHAQTSMVYSLGLSPQMAPGGHHIFGNVQTPKDEFTFDLAQVKASYFLGAGVRHDVKPFFFMAEAQYNKREYVYDIQYTYPAFVRTEDVQQYSETMHMINVPLTIGVDLGFAEVTSGFLPQFVVGHQSELANFEGYSDQLKTLRFGWQAGVAAKLSNFRLGLNWQMDFNNYADHLYINGEGMALQGSSNRLVGSISCKI